MGYTRFVTVAAAAAVFGPAALRGQTTPSQSAGPHTIVVQLVERAGPMPYAFEPANFTAIPGDTIRFVQAASVMHNVHFKAWPKGAHLGAAAVSQYLTAKGQATSIVIDSRFADGRYEIVCDPHETIGMHAFLTVEGHSTAAGGGVK